MAAHGAKSWNGPQLDSSVCIRTTEMHTCGDPARIVESGFPVLPGETLREKRDYAISHLQYLRVLLTNEPRGHRDMIGLIRVEPDKDSGAAVGVIFMDSSVYLDMCGAMTIALARYSVDRGLVAKVSPVTSFKIQAPCGVVTTNVQVTPDGKTGASSFISVPAFVWQTDVTVEVEGIGKVTVDISFGGAFYAILSAADIGLDVTKDKAGVLTKASSAILEVLRSSVKLQHPVNSHVTYLQGLVLTDGNDAKSTDATRHLTTLCEYEQVARSPCGSGTTARVAVMFHKGRISLNETRVFENAMTNTQFRVTPRTETTCGDFPAVEVEIEGTSFYTGSATFTYEDSDPTGAGFVPL